MNFWSGLATVVVLAGVYGIIRGHQVARAARRTEAAWRVTTTLLDHRRDFAHQLILFADANDLWNDKVMTKLINASASTKNCQTVGERYLAEASLGAAISEAVVYLKSQSNLADSDLMESYWNQTNLKLDFANSYYEKSVDQYHQAAGTRIGRTLVKTGLVKRFNGLNDKSDA